MSTNKKFQDKANAKTLKPCNLAILQKVEKNGKEIFNNNIYYNIYYY